MSLFEFLQKVATSLQVKREFRYGGKIQIISDELIQKDSRNLTFLDSLILIKSILSFSPLKYMKNLFSQLADYDTRKRLERIESMKNKLEKQVSEDCHIYTGFFVRNLYSRDLSEIPKIIEKLFFKTNPFLVLQPKSTQDVISIFDFATKERISIFPRGVGSSGFGGSIPTNNGIVIDLSPMNKILKIDPENLIAEFEPGVRWGELDKAAKNANLELFTYPTSRFSTVGGWIATGGFGLNSLKYGHIINHVTMLDVVFPDGKFEKLHRDDPRFTYFFGTEGQMGIILKIHLKLKKTAVKDVKDRNTREDYHNLLFFDDAERAFSFSQESLEQDFNILNIKYLDKKYIQDLNYILSLSKPDDAGKFITEKNALLYNFENEESLKKFLKFSKERGIESGKSYMSSYLFGDRYSPLKVKKLGPSLLACEIILSPDKVFLYISLLESIGEKFRIKFLFQVTFVKEKNDFKCLIISMFTCDQRKFFRYFIYLNLIQYSTYLGMLKGGTPYGIGIWNSPFLKHKYNSGKLKELKKFKRRVDPKFILNPMKVFSIRSRFFNVPALLLHPVIFKMNMHLIIAVGGFLAKHGFLERERIEKKDDGYKEIALQCTSCGSCSAICPAYIKTRDERVIARSKLRLYQDLLEGKKISDIEAENFFLCIRCGMCERVCQSRLPLRELWDEFEKLLKEKYEIPYDRISQFIASIDEDRCFLDLITENDKKGLKV